MGSSVFAQQICQLGQTGNSPLQCSAALLQEDGSAWNQKQSAFGFCFQVAHVKFSEREGKGDTADDPVCRFPAALVGGRLCWTPSSPNKVCKSPQPATMPQLFHLHRGTPSHWQLPSSQDHREGELCQGEAGTTCSDRTRGENLVSERICFVILLLRLSLLLICWTCFWVQHSHMYQCVSWWFLLQHKCLALIFQWGSVPMTIICFL